MNGPTDWLDTLTVASPCSASWSAMEGDDQVRHCRHCNQNVYNLSAMTREQAAELILKKEGRLCARFYRRADGTVLTADCPEVKRRRRRRIVGGVIALFVVILADLIAYPRVRSKLAGEPRGPLLVDLYDRVFGSQVTMGDLCPPGSLSRTDDGSRGIGKGVPDSNVPAAVAKGPGDQRD